jgi:hypothetical protein
MAEVLEMRRNTIWQFRKKVDDEIQSNGKSYLNALLSYGYDRSLKFEEIQ